MKKIALIGLVLSIIGVVSALYLEFVIVPQSEKAALQIESSSIVMDDVFDDENQLFDINRQLLFEKSNMVVNVGSILIFIPILTFIFCLIPVFKKSGVAWLGVGLSLVAFFMIAVRSTHIFS